MVVVFCLVLGTIVGVARGARKLVPITVDFDEHTVRAHSTQGRVSFRWDAVERLADDDWLFVLVTPTSRLVIPKRVLVDAAVDGIRARCAAESPSPGGVM